jgi:UDP-N-acetylmuramate dehydrogenase
MTVPTTPLAAFTTLRLGGPPRRFVVARTDVEVIQAVCEADALGEPVLILGGGSNLVVADEGFPGTVIQIVTRGITSSKEGERTLVRAQAGEPWDEFVAATVVSGLSGVECLSGIPGLVGATPIQNVGAYGQEVSDTVLYLRAFNRQTREIEELESAACHFSYRSSIFKRRPETWVVLAVTFALQSSDQSWPIRYAELARDLKVDVGDTVPLHLARDAVLRLRRRKGMVLDPEDADTVSAGSFFTNPILSAEEFRRFQNRMLNTIGTKSAFPAFPQPDGRVKLSAAWLVEHAGFHRGFGNPDGIALSSKHALAITNRGRGTATELGALACEIKKGVEMKFGVTLVPEPAFAGG